MRLTPFLSSTHTNQQQHQHATTEGLLQHNNSNDSGAGAPPQQQQQHLLKRHSSPGSFSRTQQSQQSQQLPPQRSLARRPSVIPGPSYPFPSEAPPRRPTGVQGLWHSVLKPFRRARLRVQGYTFLDWLQLFLPCVRWLRTYRVKEFLLWDIIAGISVGFMVVPQGMSYANIAGVPSVFGLYGALTPVLVYAVFGSSRELAVGPVAVTSLLISSSLKEVVPGSADITNPNNPPAELVPVQELYNHRAIQLSLLVACMYTAVGVFNLGFLTNFLSHSVIGGFTSGAAIIIGMSQLKYILGYNVPRADKLYEQIHLYIEGIHGFVWQEYVMGVTLLTMLLTIKYFGKRYPRLKWLRPLGPISACVVAIIAVVAGDLQNRGIKIVGHIPAGLPHPTVSYWMPMEDAASLAPLALVVMVVDLLESTSIARALAAKGKYELNANQEIVGLGLANFAGSAFNAYSTTGSFSRSAVNYDSGCKTGLSGFVTGCVVGLVLLVMTPVFEKLPLNVMGAIVISGVSGLFEYEEAVHLFKVRKLDWCVWMCSFLSTMFLGVEIGLAISIGLALMIVIYESAFPHTAMLGRVGTTTIYRNIKQYTNSQVIPGIAACRVDAAIYFANVAYIHERLRKYVMRAEGYSEAAGTRLQYVLLDMSPVTHLDSTGASLLEKVHDELQHQGIQLGLCNPACAVVALLERTGFPDLLGREWIFVRMHDAVQTCLAAMISDGQAVRPLSAYDSYFAATPRALTLGAPAGPGPLLFRPPGRHSPSPPRHRQSAPGLHSLATAGERSWHRTSTTNNRNSSSGGGGGGGSGGSLFYGLSRRSLDGGGSGLSPLLPHKCHGGATAGDGVQHHTRMGFSSSPRFNTAGDVLDGGSSSSRGVFAAAAAPPAAAGSPRVSAGTAAAVGAAAGAGGYSAGQQQGYSNSSEGPFGSYQYSSRVRPESAPGFRSSSPGGGGGMSGQQQQWQQEQHLSAGVLDSHTQQQHQGLHQQPEQPFPAAWAAGAVASAAGVGGTHQHSSAPISRLSSTTGGGGGGAATQYGGDTALLVHPDGLSPGSAAATAAAGCGLSGVPPGLPPLQIHTSSSVGGGHTAPAAVAGGGLSSACSVSSLPPVSLGGLHLHINPQVLNHPAVLSRSASVLSDRGSAGLVGAVGGDSGPLSSSSSFRRPVSPRTERMLDEVFSASNGDEAGIGFGVAGEGGGGGSSQGHGHHTAMLQLSEMSGSEDTWGAVGLRMPAASATDAVAGGGYEAGTAAAPTVAGGGMGGSQQQDPPQSSQQAAGGSASPLAEVRLLLGHQQPGASTRQHVD